MIILTAQRGQPTEKERAASFTMMVKGHAHEQLHTDQGYVSLDMFVFQWVKEPRRSPAEQNISLIKSAGLRYSTGAGWHRLPSK